MVHALIVALVLVADAPRRDTVYVGQWQTTNRPLNGTMTCVVSDLGGGAWRGRFSGVWQGAAFDYTVEFTGSPDELRGTAMIDGASYRWAGSLEPEGRFRGSFSGSRYEGHFNLAARRTFPLQP
jgi:hypothetical protein